MGVACLPKPTDTGETVAADKQAGQYDFGGVEGRHFCCRKHSGTSTLDMTKQYVNLITADLQAVHGTVSLLAAS